MFELIWSVSGICPPRVGACAAGHAAASRHWRAYTCEHVNATADTSRNKLVVLSEVSWSRILVVSSTQQ